MKSNKRTVNTTITIMEIQLIESLESVSENKALLKKPRMVLPENAHTQIRELQNEIDLLRRTITASKEDNSNGNNQGESIKEAIVNEKIASIVMQTEKLIIWGKVLREIAKKEKNNRAEEFAYSLAQNLQAMIFCASILNQYQKLTSLETVETLTILENSVLKASDKISKYGDS